MEKMKKMTNMMLQISGLFALLGIILFVTTWIQEFSVFSPLQQEYWSIDKATRDAAPAGSDLANQLAAIKQFGPKLMTFKLIGIGSVLVGIWISLFVIAQRLGMMPERLAKIMKS